MTILFNPGFVAVDGNGTPYAGAKLYFYVTGTTTLQTTYNDADLADPSHANTNPVVADASGLFGPIYLNPSLVYKAVLKTSADVTIWTRDPIGGPSGIPVVTVYTASSTHSRTLGAVKLQIEALGGGAGGGGCANTAAGTSASAGGGGGGSWSSKLVTAATFGTSQVITIGAAGTGGSAGNNPGTNGSDTSVGSLCIGKGGGFGGGSAGSSVAVAGAGGVAGTGDITIPGYNGAPGTAFVSNSGIAIAGAGGNSRYGSGGVAWATTGTAAGQNAVGYGAGGSGGSNYNAGGAAAGGNGSAGLVIITEYIG